MHVQTTCLALPLRGQLSSEVSSGGAWGLGSGLGQCLWKALGLMLTCGPAQAHVQAAREVPLALLAGKELIFRTSAVWPEGHSRPRRGCLCLAVYPVPFWGLAANWGLPHILLWFLPGWPRVPGPWAAAGTLVEWAGRGSVRNARARPGLAFLCPAWPTSVVRLWGAQPLLSQGR